VPSSLSSLRARRLPDLSRPSDWRTSRTRQICGSQAEDGGVKILKTWMPSFGTCFGRRRWSAVCKRTFRVRRSVSAAPSNQGLHPHMCRASAQWNAACLGSNIDSIRKMKGQNHPVVLLVRAGWLYRVYIPAVGLGSLAAGTRYPDMSRDRQPACPDVALAFSH
jgi:hypothetical protein